MPSPLCPPLSAHNPRSVFVSVCSCMCVWRAGEDTHCYIPLTIPPSLSPLWDLFHYILASLPPSEIFSLLFTRLFDSLALSLSPVCLRSSSLMKSHLSHFFSWLLQADVCTVQCTRPRSRTTSHVNLCCDAAALEAPP